MQCPHCGLFNPSNAQRCDCGYDFASRQMQTSYLNQAVALQESSSQYKLVSISQKLGTMFLNLIFWIVWIVISWLLG